MKKHLHGILFSIVVLLAVGLVAWLYYATYSAKNAGAIAIVEMNMERQKQFEPWSTYINRQNEQKEVVVPLVHSRAGYGPDSSLLWVTYDANTGKASILVPIAEEGLLVQFDKRGDYFLFDHALAAKEPVIEGAFDLPASGDMKPQLEGMKWVLRFVPRVPFGWSFERSGVVQLTQLQLQDGNGAVVWSRDFSSAASKPAPAQASRWQAEPPLGEQHGSPSDMVLGVRQIVAAWEGASAC